MIFDGLNISSLAYQIATQKKLVIHDKITYVSAEHLDLPQEAFEIDSTIPESSLEDHVIDKFNRYKDLLFLRKHNDWQTESEFRIIIYDSDTDDGYFYFDLKGILKAIIVGDKMPAVYQDIVRTKCQELGCRFGKIQWQEHRYALALEK